MVWHQMKKATKKKSHTSSELRIIESFLFSGRHTILCWNGERQLNPTVRKEVGPVLYIGINSIRDHAHLGWYLKAYWLKEQNVLPQQAD